MDNFLKIKSIKKIYNNNSGGNVTALDNLSLNISKNEITVLIGPSGCGKTTLLNIISGIEDDFTGTINIPNCKRNDIILASLSQHYTLFPWRNIINNVAFSLELKGEKKSIRLKKAKALLKKVGLTNVDKSFPHELSGGMRQRAALAQALAKEPDLLLLDEPFGALDDATRSDIRSAFLHLIKNENLTAILVTHNIEEAILLADTIFVLSSTPGSIIAEEKITLPQPRNPLSDQFLYIVKKIKKLSSAF